MAAEEDLFAFVVEEKDQEHDLEGDHQSRDKMTKIEKAKENDAKSRAEDFLKQMVIGGGLEDDVVVEEEMEEEEKTVSSLSRRSKKAKRQIRTVEQNEESAKKLRTQQPTASGSGSDIEAVVAEEEEVIEEGEDEEKLGTLEAMPRITVHTIETEEKCLHEVAIPHGQSYVALQAVQTEAAKTYPFPLDPFQKEAIRCLDNYQSVLVSAHTSAGKTVVALLGVFGSFSYAIAMSMRDRQRVIYTTPIKALSNQKYRELSDEFKDVGLMTGDVTLNPSASILVMTTEILRSMLYRGSEIMREVGWVVFDEIHYMRDKERGVVWEETIILLPDSVHYVFLSATIPNARQFAVTEANNSDSYTQQLHNNNLEWVCWLHDQPCHVVYTDYRPVPLQHFIFPCGSDGLYEVVTIDGKFKEDRFEDAMKYLKNEAGDSGRRKKRFGGTKGDSDVQKIIRTVKEKDMVPVICFCFSRRECEGLAGSLKDLDFNNAKEKTAVDTVFEKAMETLNESDRSLPQIIELLPFLERGIGIHHSGLLPILKETIEIMFSEGLIKVLFATETFSMGLNMPARTVVFSSARKFDGKDYRWISSGEYVQMSGRAGRRGKDDRGLVILMVDQEMGSDVAKQVVKGQPDPLNSQFRLTYNMVLNLLRVEEINPEFMLERSFFQFQNYASLPGLYAKVKKAESQHERIVVPRSLEIEGYCKIERKVEVLRGELLKVILKPQYAVPFLNAGRLVKIAKEGFDFGWGALLDYKRTTESSLDPTKTKIVYRIDVCLRFEAESVRSCRGDVNLLRPANEGDKGQMEVMSCLLDMLTDISAVRLKLPADLKNFDRRQAVGRLIQECHKRFPDGLPKLDPIEDMKIGDKNLKKVVEDLQLMEKRKYSHPLLKDPKFKSIYESQSRKQKASEELKAAKEELKKAKSLLQMDELKCRKRVLRRMGYAETSDVITAKGRVACEISAADELLLTELLFAGTFNDLSLQDESNLGYIVFAEMFVSERAEMPQLEDKMQSCLRQLQVIVTVRFCLFVQQHARRIAQVSTECKLPVEEDLYVEKFKPHLMPVVHNWCSGMKFADILEQTQIFEGSIIRTLRRLEELQREMVCAAKSIGNTELGKKFEEARQRLKRDIVFAASLYLPDQEEIEAQQAAAAAALQ